MASKTASKPDAAAEKRRLPAKENSLFQSIAKAYEMKQYKKGLKVPARAPSSSSSSTF